MEVALEVSRTQTRPTYLPIKEEVPLSWNQISIVCEKVHGVRMRYLGCIERVTDHYMIYYLDGCPKCLEHEREHARYGMLHVGEERRKWVRPNNR